MPQMPSVEIDFFFLLDAYPLTYFIVQRTDDELPHLLAAPHSKSVYVEHSSLYQVLSRIMNCCLFYGGGRGIAGV